MGGVSDLSEAIEDAVKFGMPAEMLDELAACQSVGFEVWPINMPIVDTFLSIATQWRAVSLADGRVHWKGLDYTGVLAGFRLARRTVDTETWAGVRIMEREAASALNGDRR